LTWPRGHGGPEGALVVSRVDARGQVKALARRPIAQSRSLLTTEQGALVILWAGHVEALRPDGQSLWRWRLPGDSSDTRLEALLPGKDGGPGWVVARSGTSLFGLDSVTGQPIWRCEQQGGCHFLASDDLRGWPGIVTGMGNCAARQCLLPLPVDENGKYRLEALARATASASDDTGTTGRPLPWAGYGLSRNLMLWLVPFLLVLVFCLLRGDLVNLLRLVFAAAVVSAVLALLLLAGDAAARSPEEGYALTGWYFIVPPAAALLGVLLLPVLLLRALLGMAGWRFGWLAWLLLPVLALLLLCTVPLYFASSDGGRPSTACLLGALGTAVTGALVLLASVWLGRRRTSGSVVAES
jgi:hypothetical protein